MRSIRQLLVLFAAVAAPLAMVSPAKAAAKSKGHYIVYVGTYTGARSQSQGIYGWRFDATSGKVDPIGLVGETNNPSFLAIHPNGKYLYAVSEIANYEGHRSGAVAAFSIDAASGKLTPLNKVPSRGTGPCHLTVDRTGKGLIVVNYNSGSVASYPLKEDGSIGESTGFDQHSGEVADKKRQGGPHAHSVNMSPDNRFAVVADLGLDALYVYHWDPDKTTISANDPPLTKVPPRSGPRHFTFHPDGKHAYVIDEIASTVIGFNYDKQKGVLTAFQNISTLPKDFSGVSNTAEVQVHPSGKFLYGSNRGHDSIAIFSINKSKGTLTPVDYVSTQGKTPRNFGIDPTGAYLFAANQDTNNIVIFKIDQKTGKLTPTGQVLEAGAPVCVKFLPVD